MATAKRNLTNLEVQGPRVVDLRDDVVSVDKVARRLDIPKKTLYGWRYKGAPAPAATGSASTCDTAGVTQRRKMRAEGSAESTSSSKARGV